MGAEPKGLKVAVRAWLDRQPWRREAVAWLCAQGAVAYLVGGTVRDALLGHDGRDMDLAIDGDALALGRGLADHLQGAYVPLDVDRNVSRVVIRTPSGFGDEHLDLAGLRGDDIASDLHARDLTVNAMAVRVSPHWGELLDPTGGLPDLDARVLRVAGPDAFADDPLRILRVARMRVKLGFAVDEDTLALMDRYAPRLAEVSPERVRDELFLMLAQPNASDGLAFAQERDLLRYSLPVSVTQAGIASLVRLEEWLRELQNVVAQPSDDIPEPLVAHREGLDTYWHQRYPGGRSRACLLKLAAVLEGEKEPAQARARLARHLCLSSPEVRYLGQAVVAQPPRGDELDAVAVYRHYRRLGDAGVDAAALTVLAEPGDRAAERWAGQLLDAWFMRRDELVDPPRLVTGQEVMAQAELAPGPAVGATIERLREAQVRGLVASRKEALAWLVSQRKRPSGGSVV